MSRSKRKNPIFGMAGNSDKWDKRQANRKLRRKSKSLLKSINENALMPLMREVSNIWSMNKDGKFFGIKQLKKI